MQLGVIGLGTMGANLARNAARNGAKVAVYNRTTEKMEEFIMEYGSEGEFVACKDYTELAAALNGPRAIMIMVKAGPAVDAVIEELLPHLSSGDILIDGGNSHYPDTVRRAAELEQKGFKFVGMGVSGGEEGALEGPSMMPGGTPEAWDSVDGLLTKMAADDGAGGKCVSYIGPGGAGHFVKMVHNGIEYGIMQLIAESYAILKDLGGFSNEKLAETFAQWNEGDDLQSFLMEITAEIFKRDDNLIDVIKDAAGQKGTGKWTTFAAMDYGVAIPTITAAVDARIISGSAEDRAKRQKLPVALNDQDIVPPAEKLASQVRTALGLSVICAYQQGFDLIERASQDEGWNVDLSETARIWRGGCIIRSVLLEKFQRAYGSDAKDAQVASESIVDWFNGERQRDWRRIVTLAQSRGVAVPALAASLSYYDAFRTERLPQSLIQAQRDFFGAHTYERIDKEGAFHTEWA